MLLGFFDAAVVVDAWVFLSFCRVSVSVDLYGIYLPKHFVRMCFFELVIFTEGIVNLIADIGEASGFYELYGFFFAPRLTTRRDRHPYFVGAPMNDRSHQSSSSSQFDISGPRPATRSPIISSSRVRTLRAR